MLMAAAVILIPEMLSSGPDRNSPEKSADAGEGAVKTYTIDLSQSPGVTTATNLPQATDNRAPPPDEMPSTSAPPAEQPAPEPQAQPESTAPPTEFSVDGSPPPTADIPADLAEPRSETPTRQEPRSETPPRPEPRAETPPRQIAAQPARAEAPPQSPPQPKPEQARAEPAPQPQPQAKPEVPPKPVASAPSAPTSSVPAGKGWAVQLGSYSSEATAQRLMNEWRAKGQNAFVMPVKSGAKTLYRVRIGPTKDRATADAALKSVKASIPGAAVVAHP